jgi:hypothetical protein
MATLLTNHLDLKMNLDQQSNDRRNARGSLSPIRPSTKEEVKGNSRKLETLPPNQSDAVVVQAVHLSYLDPNSTERPFEFLPLLRPPIKRLRPPLFRLLVVRPAKQSQS